jgi:two-component system, NtrC family, sensor histidine kinase HydH
LTVAEGSLYSAFLRKEGTMFRVKETEPAYGFAFAQWVVRITLWLALLANIVSAVLIFQEHRHLTAWLEMRDPMEPSGLAPLRREVAIQFASSLTVSLILVFSLAATWWLRRRYLLSQRALRQVKMLAHDILASMDRGIVTTDEQGVITSVNSAALQLLQAGIECVGRPLEAICSEDLPLTSVCRHVVETREPIRDRDFTVARACRELRLRVDGHLLKDFQDKPLGCVIHVRNVTERILLEERMRRMERFLGLATLASGLHHEIKNPLTALSIHIQLLEESLQDRPDCESMIALVNVVKTEACRLNGVLENFRSFANLQHLTIQPTNVVDVVSDAVRLVGPQAAEQNVRVSLLQPDETLPLVPLDAEKFQQVVLNLVINALEAMPEGGVLTLRCAADDGRFRLSVSDTGRGIPAEVEENLFRPYFSTKSAGSGLGLALSEKLISQHGGQIEYRTGPQGTTFDVTVPIDHKSPAA